MKWMSRISAADFLTVTNGLLGVLAITYILDGEHLIACLLILTAVAIDGLDGMVARRFGTPHEFGRFLDSISDAISFCMAPALLIYNNFYDQSLGSAWVSMPNAIAVITTMFYASFSILRLARFAGRDYSEKHFKGLPTPAAAVVVIILTLLWGNPEVNPFAYPEMQSLAIIMSIILSFLMVSDIPYPNIRGWMVIPAGLALLITSIPVILYQFLRTSIIVPAVEIESLALALLFSYIIFGPFLVKYNKSKRKRKKTGQ
jgi:CDP-diacylglycerol--serine O-phosphatidyltransferase